MRELVPSEPQPASEPDVAAAPAAAVEAFAAWTVVTLPAEPPLPVCAEVLPGEATECPVGSEAAGVVEDEGPAVVAPAASPEGFLTRQPADAVAPAVPATAPPDAANIGGVPAGPHAVVPELGAFVPHPGEGPAIHADNRPEAEVPSAPPVAARERWTATAPVASEVEGTNDLSPADGPVPPQPEAPSRSELVGLEPVVRAPLTSAAAGFLQRERALGRAPQATGAMSPSSVPVVTAAPATPTPPVFETSVPPATDAGHDAAALLEVTGEPVAAPPSTRPSAGEDAGASLEDVDTPFAERQAAKEVLEGVFDAPAAGTLRQSQSSGAARAALDAAFTVERGGAQARNRMPVLSAAPPALDSLEARFQSWLAPAAGVAEAAAAPAEAPDVPAQVIKAIHLQWRDGLGEARVQLRPEHLGSVTVSLRVEQGHVVASVRAESPAALEMIRARQQELQSALEDRGLRLDEFVVTLDPDDRRERPAYRQPEPAVTPRRRDTGVRFEVIA